MHVSVLLEESVKGLNLQDGDKAIDCTFGDGGHTEEILKQVGSKGKVLAIDTDEENIKKGRKKFIGDKNLVLVNDNFVHLKKIAEENNFLGAQGILMDLGWSSTQFSESGKGFSFLKDEPLDMRLGGGSLTAQEIINTWSEKEIGTILREYGEESSWKKIAEGVVVFRKKQPIITSGQLASFLEMILGGRTSRLHPATKTFQALRIAVNDELTVLKETLPQAVEVLATQGRLAVISFHSLEDRIVKHFFQQQSGKNLKIINKKPLVATAEELAKNPRSRSAKLRIIEKF